MSRSKSGLFSRIRQAIHGRRKSNQARYQRRQFLRMEALELRTVMAVAAADGPYNIAEDNVLSVDAASGVLANDTLESGTTLTADLEQTTANGDLILNADGSFDYTPDEHFFGTDTFTYRAVDASGESDIVTVTIDVAPTNDTPLVVDDAYLVQKDGVLTVDVALGVLANDLDVDDDKSVLTVTKTADPDSAAGTVTLGADGSFTFTPVAGYSGPATFKYTVSDDGGATSAEATVTITVNAPPTVQDVQDQTTAEGVPLADIPFTVGDTETAAGALNVTFSSSDQTLIPDDNLTLGGSDGNRTISISPAAGETGSATITITVTDANGGSVTDTFLVTVAADAAPTIDAIADQTTDEDQPIVDLPVVIGDAETDPADLTVTFESDNQTLIPDANIILGGSGANRTITVNPAANQFGSATITLTVTDEAGNSATQTFQVTVADVNDDPTITDIQNQTTPFNTPIVDLPFQIADVDNDVATITPTATSDNQALIPDANILIEGTGADRTITITPVLGQSGTAIITVTVDDGEGGTVTDTFEVTVSANADPTISDVGNQTVVENGQITGVTVDIGDAETADDALEVTAVSDNLTLLPTGSIVISTTGGTRTITITPAEGETGTATVTLTVDDGFGGTATDTFEVTVTANTLPTITDVGDQTTDEDQSIVDIPVVVGDAETDANDLQLTAASDNQGLIPDGNIVVSGSGPNRTITITPVDNGSGSATITLTVSDGNGGTTTDTFLVTVDPQNDLPTISDVGNQTVVENGEITGLTVDVDDVETADDDLIVTAVSDNTTLFPSGSIVVSTTGGTRSLTLTPANGETGTATITLTVDDGNGGTVQDTFTVTVTANTPPTISDVVNQTVVENGEITGVTVEIGDAETADDDLEVTALSDNLTLFPSGSIVVSATGGTRTITITPAEGETGTATITLTVEDGNGGTATDTFTVTVTANTPPTISDVGNQTVAEDGEITGVTVDVGDAETADDDLVVTALSDNLTLFPSGSIVVSTTGGTRTITITPADGETGTATITLTVDDGNGGTATDTFTVTVTANTPPTISPVADLSTNEDTATGNITVSFSDAETAAANLTFSVVSSNTTLVPNANIAVTGTGGSRNLVITPAGNQSGQTTITITVTDASGVSSTETFVLTVNPVNDVPTAVNDTYTTTEETVLTISNVAQGVLGNDTDPESQALSTVLVLAPSSGQLVLNTNGTFTYTPATNFSGTVTFQYRARDASNGESNIATVTINVTNVNDAPTAVADNYTTNLGNTLTVNAADGVLDNDSDPDSGTTLTAQLVSSTTNGTLNLAANGSFTYTPNAGFSGVDSFTYRVSDGSLQSSAVTVNIAVSAVASGQPIIVGPTSGVRGQTLTYQLSVIGGTSTNVTYSIDWNGDGTNDQTVTGPGNGTTVTHVFATSGTNNIRVQAGSPAQSTNLAVTITDTQRIGSTFVVGGTTGNDSIVVQKVGRAGIRVLVNGTAVGGVQTGVKMVEVSGGVGNDSIVMAGNVNAIAMFRGGAGNDRLVGGKLGDFLFGDEGNDILNGLGASDFLSAGTGDDSLNGGQGHDVLFGGDGVDSLVGGSNYNLMIGGTTDFDNDFKTQKAILHAWAAGGTFQMRMNRLNFMSKGGLKLVQNDTVNTDGDADRIVSTGSRDWIFAAIADADRVIGKQRGRIVT